MADIDKRVRTLWSAMSQDGKYSGSVESFNDQFFQSGKRGYEFRYGIYKQFKDAGADVGKDYHDFSKRFGLHATSPKASSGSIYDRVNKRINDARQTVAGVDPTSGAVPVANAVKAMQNDRPMTDAERRQMMQSADNIIGSTDLMKQQWENQGKYREQRTGLKTKTPVLGQNQNVVEQKEYNPETGEIEDTYLTSEGNVYANRFEADREQDATDDFMDRQLNPIEAELRDAYAERDRLEEMMKNRNQELGATAYGTYYGGAAGMNATEDKEWEQLSAAYNKNKALITTLEDKRNNAMNDYFHTLGNEITNGYNFTLGLADAIDSNAIAQAQKHIDSINKKRENGEKLTHEEEVAEAVLKNMAWDNDVQARYGDEYGMWADAAKMTATSADLMAEFLLTGGMPLSLARSVMNGVVKGGVKLLGKGATKGLGKYMLKTTGATLGSMVAGAEMANTVGAGRTGNDIVKRYTGDVLTDENGNYVLGHYDENNNIVAGGDTLLDAVLSAERQGISEYGSEVAGGLFPNGGKLLTKGLEKIGLDKLSKFLTTVSGKEWYKAYSKALETLGFNGVAGEGLEEYAGTAFDAMMGGDEWKNLADPKTHINIWLGCLTMSAFMNAPRATATAYQYGRYKAATNKSDKVAERQLGEEWQNIRSRIDNTKNEDMASVVYDVLNNNELAKEQKTAVMDYIKNLQQLRGFTLGEAAVERGGEEKAPEEQSVDQSYTQGYNAESNEDKQDVKNDLEDKADALSQFADESTLNALDEDGIGTLKEIMARDDWSDEQKQAALDYVNAKATYEGMIDRVKDDIETEVADSDAAIDRRVASQEQGGDGMIHPATMAKDNRQVDIISGNVVMSDDGSMVDTQKSDKDIIVRDRQTGKVEFANPKEIKSVEAPIDAEQLKASERERITNERAQAASNAIDGVLPMQQGDQYTLTYNGEQHQVQVVQDNGDGTVSVIIDGAKEPQDMAKEQLQDLANQSNRARLEQSRQQTQQQAPVEETPTETPTTTTAEIQETTPEEAPTEVDPEEAPKLEGNGLRKDMPMREDGNPAFMEVTPERTQQFLYGEESGMTEDEATQFVDKNIAAAEKALEEVKKGAPEVGTDFAKFKAEKAAYQQQLDAAQAAVDYWNNVKTARQAAMAAPMAQQAPVEQNAPEAVQPSEVESNATPIETTQEAAPEASVESAEEKPTTRLKGSGLKSEEQIAEEQKKKEEQKAAEQKKEEEKKAKRQEKFRKRAESWGKKTGVKVNIIDNVDDVENAEAKAAIKKGRKVKGWWQQSNNEIYIYLPNMESMDDVDETFIHEAVAHRGLRHLLGEEEFGKLCDKVFDAMSPKEKARYLKYVGVSEKDIKEGKYTDKQKRAAADELMAAVSEHTDLNPTLWEQICNWIREALGRTIDVDKVKMSNESIQRLIRASYAHYQAEAKKAAAENLEEQGMAADTERGDVRFAVADVLKGDDIDKVTKELMDVTGRSESTVKKWLKAEQSLAKIILDNDNVAFLDLQVDESVPSIWNNADYPQGTVEFSNICRKRLPLTMIYQKLQKEFPNLVFDAKTLESIRGILKENGVDVACGLCFVEDRRQLLGEIGKGFIDMLQGKNNFVNDNQNKALNKLRESGDEYVPNLYELLTLDGMKKLRREHPSVAQAFIEYNNARGMQAGRLFQAYSAYHREILKYNKAKVRSINNNGGLRIFSFSDFEAHHLIDLVQVLTDCAAKGIKVQGYTKVPEFANAVKDTGMKLNRSLIAKGKGYVDEDYVPADNEAVSPNVINGKRLLLDCVEGIDVNHPDFFDSTDNKNVGNILVGINDEQIHMAMEDPFVDYIIPFHTGLSKDILKQKNIGEWVNYKLMQLEKVDNGRGGLTNAPHHGINIYTDVLPRGEELIGHPIKNVRDFQMAFFKACEEKGYVPRFEKFINRGKNGEYVYTKGYEKLLLDFKLFDKNGKIVPQEAVVPVFDDKVNKRILEDYVKGEKEKAPNDELYDKVKEGLGLDGGVRYREDEERKIQGLENYTEQEIKDIVLSEVQSKLAENEIYDVDIKDIAIHGSRGRGTAREDSDLDVVVEYDGNWKEDTLFNILNDEPIFIEGIQVDVNPITKWKSGTMTEYMKRSDAYDREILEAKENGDEVRFREGDTFYSPAERAVENIKQEKATGEQWLKMIEKNGGLKKEEDKWMGLSDFLKDKKSLTKQEVLDFIRENQVKVEEVEYGNGGINALQEEYDELIKEHDGNWEDAWDEMIDRYGDDIDMAIDGTGGRIQVNDGFEDYLETINGTRGINSTRLEYTTEGLDNKKEIALTVPTIESWNEDDEIHFGDAGEGRAVAWIRFGETTDKDGNRVLVIDEIQSKRHQEGREKGYKNPTVYKDATIGEYHKTSYGEEADIIGANGNKIGTMTKDADGYYATDNDGDNMTSTRSTEAEALQAMDNAFSGSGIPDAPFQKNWHELAMKRMLRYAAENGYDKVAWTKGEQQADRYSLAKTIPSITRQDTKKAADKGIKVFAMDINGEPEKIFVDNDGTITNTTLFMDEVSGKPLSDFVGKDIAIRMMSMNDGETIDTSKEKVGGEGMKGFYDQMLPRFMDKYGKKWGVKTGEVELPNVEEAGRTMWSVDVTPEMKDSVMEGQTMFRVADDMKKAQMDIISKNNPADESLGEHTWIKSVDDIKTFDEAMTEYGENENLTPDYTADMARKAKETGKITVYSSKPIDNGIFVTPSKMEAKNYAGEGEVYSKKVRTSDVAWIDGIQGQYAKVEGSQPRFRVADDITPEEATEKKARKKAKKNEGEVRFSEEEPKYIDPRNMPYKDRKRRGDELRTISAIEVKPNQIVSKEGKSARKVAEEWWDTNVGEPHWYDTEVGKVEINRNTVESSLAHRYGQKKLDAITSLVDGFKNAVYLGTLKDADRRATFNHFFAYPIMYNGKRCYVFCRALHDNNTNRLYIHEVFVGENIKKGNTLQTAAFKPHGGIALYRDILANVLDSDSKDNTNISNTQEKSEENDNISFRITPEEDAEYIDAVEKRDIKKAQQMVKAAVKRAMPETKVVDEDGEPLVVYHGTDLEEVNGGEPFYTFYDDSHFGTWGQAEGRLYGRNAYFIRKNPKIYEVYLNLKNPKRVPDVPIDWEGTHADYWAQAIEQAKEEGYDGIVYKNEWEGEGDSYIAFNPNQIKSADAVTYDNNGKPIPLSERFNEGNDDIRFRVSDERRRREYAERQWRRAHNKAANTIKSLGISDNVTVVDTPEELAGYDSMTEQQKASKGWYDEDTGNIVVIVGNHTSPEDVQRTILREGVARYGLRQLFGQNYNNFLDNVLTNAETDIRREIVNIATRNGYDFRKATEEYLARLANDTDFERAMKQGWWSQIKSYFLDMLHSIGLTDWIEDDLSDNELRYMLWRSYMNLTEPNARRNPFNRAREISMRDNLKVGDYSNIEDELPVGNFDYVAEQRIRKLVSEMPMSEVRKAYERINEKMRDEDGLDIDEHMEKVREDWRNEHGSDGIGKVMADDVQMLRDKYGDGLLTLRNYLRDRIENEGETRFREDEDEVENTEENTEGGENSEENEEPLEAIDYNAGDMTLEEAATNALIRLAKQNERNLSLRIRAMHSIGGNLTKLRRAMAQQRKYDRKTVDSIVRLARMLMNTGDLNNFTRGEVKKLMSMVNRAAGKEDITKQADAVVDMMINHQLKAMEEMLHKQMKVKGSKLNQKGVEVQGALDITGQRTLAAFKDGIGIDYDTLQQRIEEAAEKMTSDNQVEADNARAEWTGYLLAERYHESILVSETEESNLRQELKQAKEDLDAGRMTREAYNEFVKTTQNAIRENRLERIKSYEDMLDNLTGNLREAVARAKEWQEKEQQRVEEIHHNANSDLEGVPMLEHGKQQLSLWDRVKTNPLFQFFLKPVATFDQLLRFFGSKSIDGRGYLFNRFMPQFIDSTQNEWKGFHSACQELDEKASEVFGKKMVWSDIFEEYKKMPTVTVEFWDNGEMREHELTQGNLLYIYAVNKMSDGKMKLRKMGITEEDVTAIEEKLDPRLKQLIDWVQDDFLVRKREDYNKVYERMFGAPMAAIENYFPLKVLERSIDKVVEIGDDANTTERPTTVTGSIIKRTRNSKPLDITGADAFDVVLEHVQQMEHWAAFAEFCRDINTLLSYKRFRNKVENMVSARFGKGKDIYKSFVDTCAIAADAYNPKYGMSKGIDDFVLNGAKLVTMAKISGRIWTAIKQVASYPAYFSEANIAELAKTANPMKWREIWKWAIENLPTFAKRWESRQAGDQRLDDTDVDWGWLDKAMYFKKLTVKNIGRIGMKPNAFVDAMTVCIGAKAIYETKKKNYLEMGFNEEQAEKKALRDAAIALNETQQSGENAFLSPIQRDRTAFAVGYTVFRNSSMGYQRRYLSALSNLKRRMRKGYKEESIAFMQKQLVREGLSEEQAQKAAERMYERNWVRDVVDVIIFGHALQFLWNVMPNIFYILMGDDGDEKLRELDDAAKHSLAGGVEGLTGGSILSDLYNKWRNGDDLSNYNFHLLPLMSDIQTTLNHFEYDKVAAINDFVNLMMQSVTGLNPQTLTDAAVAAWDYLFRSDLSMREFGIMWLRIMQAPQSTIDNMYIDDLGMTGKEARNLTVEEAAKRYAWYKYHRNQPWTGMVMSDEYADKRKDKYIKRYEKVIAERMAKMSDEDLQRNYDEFPEDRERRKMVGKEIAERMGGKDSYGNPQTAYGVVYAETRNYTDLAEDVLLQTEQKKAKQNGETEREKDINKARNRINKLKESLPETPFTLEDGTKVTKEDIMNEIRELRSEYLKEFGIKK